MKNIIFIPKLIEEEVDTTLMIIQLNHGDDC